MAEATLRIVLVLNDKSGAMMGQADPAAAMRALCEKAGLQVEIIADDRGDLPERIAQAQQSGADCVAVAGGDGTIACAAQTLTGSDTALGIIPTGTMNLLARDLGIMPGDPEAALAQLANGAMRKIDVGEVDGHIFTCASMLGTPAHLGRHREAGRRAGGGFSAWARWGRATWRALRKGKAPRLTLRFNGKTLRVHTPSVTITVNALDDKAGHAMGRTYLDGGELVIYLVRKNGIFGLLRLAFRFMTGGAAADPALDVIHTKALEIGSTQPALHVLVDGEMRLLEPPLHYRVRPKALCVIAPA